MAIRELSTQEVKSVAGGTWLLGCFSFCLPKITWCAPKPCAPKPSCEPKPSCGGSSGTV